MDDQDKEALFLVLQAVKDGAMSVEGARTVIIGKIEDIEEDAFDRGLGSVEYHNMA